MAILGIYLKVECRLVLTLMVGVPFQVGAEIMSGTVLFQIRNYLDQRILIQVGWLHVINEWSIMIINTTLHTCMGRIIGHGGLGIV